MDQQEELMRWVESGVYRSVIARVLRKPMCGTEILEASREHAPRIQLRDIWRRMNQLTERNLVQCHNPEAVTGRLFSATELGRSVFLALYGHPESGAPAGFDHELYSWIVRGKARRAILLEVSHLGLTGGTEVTAGRIKRSLKRKYPIALNLVIDTLAELRRKGIVCEAGRTRIGNCRHYELSKKGVQIVSQLMR